jgi:hypothetical protein
MSRLVDEVVTEKRIQYRSRLEVKIESKFSSDAYKLFAIGKSGEIKRAVSNLIDNSVEAVQQRGQISVVLNGNMNTVLLSIVDDGVGIPSSLIPDLGTRGVSFGSDGGTGLGLYHAKSTLESLGGELTISSELAAGTTVQLSFPRKKPPEWFIEELNVEADSEIFIVDDDKSIHQVWEGKFPALVLDEKRIKIYHFSLLSELKNVATGFKKNRKSHLYLIDYEFLGESENGLSVIEELGIASKSVLITSRSEDLSIQKRCENLGVKLMPKEVVSFLPISFNHRKLNYV